MNKTYAVADLHGMYNLWRQVIESLDETDILYVLGDCSDRGPDGWKIIKEALADPKVIYIRGNHDQMLLDSWFSEWLDNNLWFWNGGYATFDSILDDNGPDIYLHELAKTKLYYCYENKQGQKIHLSHAGFTPPIHKEKFPNNQMLLWDRKHFGDKWPKDKEKEFIVHGHTPIISSYWKSLNIEVDKANPKIIKYCNNHKICIDFGAVFTNTTVILDLDTLLPIYIKGD